MELALAVAKSRLQDNNGLEGRTSLSIDDVMRLLSLPVCHLHVLSRSVFQQTYGTAMGSPVLVTMTNLVIEDMEERVLATTVTSPRFWKRYVDDTCTVLSSHKVDDF